MTLAERLRASHFLRFAFIGATGFVANEAVLYVAIHGLGLGAYAGGIFAFLITVTYTWFGNRMLTFHREAATGALPILEEWAKYVAANTLGFVVNYTVYVTLVTFAPAPFNSPYLALAFGTLSGMVFNFTLSKRFVFRSVD